MAPTWPVVCLAFASALETLFAIALRTRMRNTAANPFALGMAMAAVWHITYALDLGTVALPEKLLLLQIRSTFLPFYTLVWFEACYRFVYGRKCLHGWRMVAAGIVPFATAVITWLPHLPTFLVFRSHYWLDRSGVVPILRYSLGPWGMIFYAFTLVFIIGCFVIVAASLREASWDRTARLLLLIGWTVGAAGNLAFMANRSPTPGLNYGPILAPLTFGLVAVALIRGRVVQLAPVGRGALIDSLEDMMVVLDQSGSVIDLNRMAAVSLGVRHERVQGAPYEKVMAPWYEVVALVKEKATGKREVRINGVVHELTLVPIADADARLQAQILILRDISDRKQIENQLQKAKEEAEAADEAKSRFLAMISHEIRTPMNAVVGFTHLLQATSIDDEQRQYLDLIVQGGKGLLVVIDDVLDYTKITSGRLELEEAPFKPAEATDRIRRLLDPKARQKGISLDVRLADGLPSVVVGDSVRFGQILTNLVSNAVKFTERGGVAVTLAPGSDPVAAGTCEIVVTVRDTGIGIAPEAMERIFQPFSQADNSITRKYGGTGLGLAISKRLCELMRGDLRVASEPGRGATFTATLHFHAAAGPAAPVPVRAPALAPVGRPLSLLVFEDNRLNQHVIGALLRKLGHRARFAGTGPEGLQMLDSEPFDALLMDIEMPGMDGYEAARIIRERERGTGRRRRVIAVTAHAMSGIREKCLAAGMDDFLTKPIDPAALKEALERCPEPGENGGQNT